MPSRNVDGRIADELAALGVREGGVLLVHSSLRAICPALRRHGWWPAPSGAELVIRGLLKALGDRGTLLAPALSFMTVGARQPVFDVLRTPSCVGALTEHFRKRDGSLRSVHPTHSVCGVGPRAEPLLRDHGLDRTPCGEHSPFRLLPEVDGQLLFLGCGLRPNTSMHAVEESLDPTPTYYFGPQVIYRILLPGGQERSVAMRSHDFLGWRQRYDRLADLMGPPDLRTGTVLDATCHLLDARAMWRTARAAYGRDSLHFVEPLQPAMDI